MIRLVTLRLGLSGKLVDYDTDLIDLSLGDKCIVPDDCGEHYAEVVTLPVIKKGFCDTKKVLKILRKVTPEDVKQMQKNREDIQSYLTMSYQKIKQSRLPIKLVDMEYTFDRNRMIFYFVAQGRVDFRRLIVKLAKMFRLRIELRQIGVRDHARLMGGLGGCGQKLCCSSHLRTFHKVSLQMAKAQDLAVVPSKVSGVCGKLLCCLAYEYDQYKSLRKTTYPKGTVVELHGDKGNVIDVYVLKQKLKVELWKTKEKVICNISDVKRVIHTSLNERIHK